MYIAHSQSSPLETHPGDFLDLDNCSTMSNSCGHRIMILSIISFLGFFEGKTACSFHHKVHMFSRSSLPTIIEREASLLTPSSPQELRIKGLLIVISLSMIGGNEHLQYIGTWCLRWACCIGPKRFKSRLLTGSLYSDHRSCSELQRVGNLVRWCKPLIFIKDDCQKQQSQTERATMTN